TAISLRSRSSCRTRPGGRPRRSATSGRVSQSPTSPSAWASICATSRMSHTGQPAKPAISRSPPRHQHDPFRWTGAQHRHVPPPPAGAAMGSGPPAVPRAQPGAGPARAALAWSDPVSNSLVGERYREVKDFLVEPCYARLSGTSCAAVAHQQPVADGGAAPGQTRRFKGAGMAVWRTPAGRAVLPGWVCGLLAVQAVVLLSMGVALFVAPGPAASWWPWTLTPLLAQATGAWLIGFGVAAAHELAERDARRLLPASLSSVLLAVLQLIALARTRTGSSGRPLRALSTWPSWS